MGASSLSTFTFSSRSLNKPFQLYNFIFCDSHIFNFHCTPTAFKMAIPVSIPTHHQSRRSIKRYYRHHHGGWKKQLQLIFTKAVSTFTACLRDGLSPLWLMVMIVCTLLRRYIANIPFFKALSEKHYEPSVLKIGKTFGPNCAAKTILPMAMVRNDQNNRKCIVMEPRDIAIAWLWKIPHRRSLVHVYPA